MSILTPSRLLAVLGSAAVLATSLAAPTIASADPRGYYDSHHRFHHYRACVRRDANNGAAIGAVGGGLATGLLTHSVVGGLVGAGVGAVAGHEIAKNRAGSRCR
jgi:hypothetical protein